MQLSPISAINQTYLTPKSFEISSMLAPVKAHTFARDLRRWQTSARIKLGGKRYTLTVASPGSGKTTLLTALGLEELVDHSFDRKILICVPKLLIGKGYTQDGEYQSIDLLDQRGHRYAWHVGENNFIAEEAEDVRKGLKEWLVNPVPTAYKSAFLRDGVVSGAIAVATHQAISVVWQDIVAEGLEAQVLQNFTLMVDEAHHASGVYDTLDEVYASEDGLQNRLGALCHAILNDLDGNSHLHLASATPYRGDMQPVVTAKIREKIEVFNLDFTEHLQTMGIDQLTLSYALYDVDPIDQILSAIQLEPNEFHLIVVPARDKRWRRDMDTSMPRLLQGLRKIYKSKHAVLNLVPKEEQAEGSRILGAETKHSLDEAKLHVVVSCRLVSEGVDWVPCSRLHNASFGISLPEEVQKIGRTTRGIKGKSAVSSTAYLPNILDDSSESDGAMELNFLNNVVLVGMLYDEAFHPIFLPKHISSLLRTRTEVPTLDPTAATGPTEPYAPATAADLFGTHLTSIQRDMIRSVEALDIKVSSRIEPILAELMDKYPPVFNHPDVIEAGKSLLRQMILRRLNVKFPKIDSLAMDILRDVDFDRIVLENDLEGNSFFFGSYDREKLKEFRKRVSAKIAHSEVERLRIYREKTDPFTKGSKVARGFRRRVNNKGARSPKELATMRQLFPVRLETAAACL